MRNRLLVSALFVATLLLAACQRRTVTLSSTNASGEVPRLGNLTFRFSKSLVSDSLLQQWDSTEYIRFEPRIPGRFRWEAPDELVFSPRDPLAPATTYTATLRPDLLAHSRFNDIKGGEPIHFHTAGLSLSDAQMTWVLQEDGGRQAVPQLALEFNYPVAPAALKEHLQVSVDGKPTPYELLTVSPANSMLLRLAGFKGEDRAYPLKVQVGAGLLPEGGRNMTTEPLAAELTMSSPYLLSVTGVSSEHDGTEGIVRVNTSQQLQGENVTQYMRFDPAVRYTVEYTDYGVALRSEQFSPEMTYELQIDKGLRGRIGGVLKEPTSSPVAFGELESEIRFTSSKALFLSKKGSGNIEVLITNTPRVKLVISKIYESNLLLVQRNGYSPRVPEEGAARHASYSDEEDEDDEYRYEDNEVLGGDVIFTKDIDTRSLPKSGHGRLLNLKQFQDRLPDLRGVYHVELRSTEDYWIRDSRLISSSDIGLIARQGGGKLFVFANSIKNATAMGGVAVQVYGSNNQLIGSGATNESGVAEVKLQQRAYAGFRPAMIIAKTNDDLTYLPFSGTKVKTSRFDVGGKHLNPAGVDAFVYAERDIYRPGETVHFAVLLRDQNWKSPGELPLKLKLLLPNGKEFRSLLKSLNEGGATEAAIDLPVSAITGSYVLEVYSSNDVLLATKNFMIEEFVPDRIKVTAKLDKLAYKPGEEARLSVSAVNFFGPPAAGRNWELEVQVKQKAFTAKGFGEYDFSLSRQASVTDKEVKEGTTDATGGAQESYAVPELYQNNGLLQASFFATVFDETGRPVSRRATADIHTQDVFHGIRRDGYSYYPLNQGVTFQLVSLNPQGAPVTARARVQVIRHEYRTVLARNGGYFRYESQEVTRTIVDEERTVGNGSSVLFVPRAPGYYELRVYRPGASAYVQKDFYSYGAWGSGGNAFDVDKEGNVSIEPDKERYKAGEKARILFKTPFSGRLLVTTEREGVLSWQYVDVPQRSASIELPLGGAHVPNVYVTATLIKPHSMTDIPLTVAHGFKSISVEEPARNIAVAIEAQKASRSNRRQSVRVKAAPNSWVTLAAVDNGVLQITDFQTPDPYKYYYQKRALDVFSYDMYPLLFPELSVRGSSTGGDGNSDMNKRVNPMPAKRVKILSYWSGLRKTDGSGYADFSFEVPPFSGQVRLMAVASRDERFGSAEATMQVADPVVISSALPRFLSPGDTTIVPVTLSNTTARAATGQVTLQVSGPLRIEGTAAQSVTLPANNESRAPFRIVATSALGVGTVTVTVQSMGETFTQSTELSVRPPSTLQQRSGSGAITGGNSQRIALPTADFLPGSTYRLFVSRSPVVELSEHLRYLVQYPYGCTEQTISAAFPQLYYGDIAALVNDKGTGKANAHANVQEAVRKIRMRQLYNGALTLWDGEGTEDWWATTYAAHFLIEARKAGFEIDNSLLETILSYLGTKLRNRETIPYYYNRDQSRRIAPKEVPYSLFVLALANRPQVPTMNYYKANPQFLALDGRYLLSAAYALAGDRRSFGGFLPGAFAGEVSVPQSGGSFYSEARDEAIALNALIDVDPGHAQVPVMARHVAARLKTQHYLNTQERVFSFLALGKLARRNAGSTASAEIRSGGKLLAQVREGAWKGTGTQLGSGPIDITVSGSGTMYYTWVAEGISRSGAYKEEDSYVRVRRSYYNRFGQPLSGTTFRQNELVIVGITLERAYSNTIDNLVLTDILPAGFEIENPRTKELPGMDWIKDAGTPTAIDVRDDRIHLFVDAREDRKTYYYAVRAVSPGQYKRGPVSADALYRGEIHSYHGAGVVRVVQ
ncbi:alpha-2-macroglobulin family protein [Flaviaesturariibacter amylovorans]|uniref:Alpha-2-macroglobulin family protein n=1 Tax=Flaviaesturariibacter amylovorans TaxID=1084520 RepID=A0ABP8GIS8_9BACT